LLEGISLCNVGEAYGREGDVERALRHCRAGVEVLERLGAQLRLARARITLASFEHAFGANDDARRTALAAIDQLRPFPPGRLLGQAALVLARIDAAVEPAHSARLLGFAQRTIGDASDDRPEIAAARELVERAMDGEAFEKERRAGFDSPGLPP
jgi:hypothetical protein